MKTRFLLAATLLVLPGAAYADSHTKHSAKTEPAVSAVPAAPVAPPTLAQMPATPPKVIFQGGLMTITAENSTLGDILQAVKLQTGAEVEFPGNASDRVVGQFGPGPARDVLADLLNGSHFNYVLLGSATNPNALDRVILTAKSGGGGEPNPAPEQTAEVNQPVMNTMAPAPFPGGAMQAIRARNGAMVQPPQNQNTVTSEPEDAPDDSASDDQDADSQDDQADDSTDDQANGDAQQEGDQAAGAADQQNPNGQQNGVKSPEQLLQELQQQQQNGQQPQPGVQPPGLQGGVPGQQPHN